MKISRVWFQVPAAAAAMLGMAMACTSSSGADDAQQVGQVAEGLSAGLDFYMNFPGAAYVGVPSWVGAGVYFWPWCTGVDGGGCDTPAAASDVTLTTTVTGNFTTADFAYWGPAGFDCTQSIGAGSVTVTCHADSFDPYSYADFGMNVTPANLGDVISATTTLTEGGTLVRTETRELTVVEPSADLAAWAWGGGTALVGQTNYTSFGVGNYGPISAVNPKFSLTLTGPGKIESVQVITGTCTWTDTTATCTAPTFPVFTGIPISLAFTGTAVGQVTFTGSITSDTPDPYLDNNEATMTFDVVQPKYADLAVTMTDTPDPAKAGKAVTYNLTVKNNGPDVAETPVLADYLPYGVLFKSATPSQGSCWGGDWGYLQCDLGAIASGGTATVAVQVVPQEGGTLTNYAYVDVGYWWPFTTIDPDYANNSAAETTTVRGPNPPVHVYSTSDRFFTSLFAYVDCAHEYVLLQGELHVSYQYIYNEKNGTYTMQQIFNPQGITGEGMNTGDTYHATGMTRQSSRILPGYAGTYTYENNFRIIGNKTGNNLMVHMTTVVVVGKDGSVKTNVQKYSYECK